MPYAIRKTPKGWAKVKLTQAESVVSHHKTKKQAIAAIRAYYANVRKMKKKVSNEYC